MTQRTRGPRTSRKVAGPALLVPIGFVLGLLLGCQREESADPSASSAPSETPAPLAEIAPSTVQRPPDNTEPGDENRESPIGAFTDLARNAHELADSARSKEELREAARKLRDAYNMVPAQGSPVMREVGDDLVARAAQLYLKLGEAAEAKGLAQKALGEGERASIVRANLLVVLADAEEVLGNKEAARDHLMSALSMNQELLKKELENP